jgi:hypothetical protein
MKNRASEPSGGLAKVAIRAAGVMLLAALSAGCGDSTPAGNGGEADAAPDANDTTGGGDTGLQTDVGAEDVGSGAPDTVIGKDSDEPTDAAADTGEAPDVSDTSSDDADTGSDDAADGAGLDVVERDGGAEGGDAGDVQEPDQGAAFLLTELSILAPTLCYDLDGAEPCEPINDLANALIQAELSGEEPLQLLGYFPKLELPQGTQSMDFGPAKCSVTPESPEGPETTACAFDSSLGGTSTFPTVFTKSAGVCANDPELSAPCFTSTPLGTVTLDVLGLALELSDALVAGELSPALAPTAIPQGLLRGFVSASAAQTVGLALPGTDIEVTLLELLKTSTPDLLPDGTVGWTFRLEFAAKRVDLAPVEVAP